MSAENKPLSNLEHSDLGIDERAQRARRIISGLLSLMQLQKEISPHYRIIPDLTETALEEWVEKDAGGTIEMVRITDRTGGKLPTLIDPDASLAIYESCAQSGLDCLPQTGQTH